jgi:class 3 adenylate cyclase
MSFIFNLFNITKKYINIRIGVAYGHLHWGYIDHNLRLFGIPINLAARLENVCPNNSICCDENFITKLSEENICKMSDIEHTKLNSDLKGLGSTDYYCINLESEVNINVFNSCKKN